MNLQLLQIISGGQTGADRAALDWAMNQPDTFSTKRTTDSITVSGSDLARTVQRLRDLGAVILSFQVKGATYTLNVILPPGELPAEALGTLPDACRARVAQP